MIYVADEKASTHMEAGALALKNVVKPVSVTCLYLH